MSLTLVMANLFFMNEIRVRGFIIREIHFDSQDSNSSHDDTDQEHHFDLVVDVEVGLKEAKK